MSITSSGIMTSTNKIRKHSPPEAPVTSCLLHEMFGTVSGHLLLVALIYSAIGNVEGAFVQTPTDAMVLVNDSTIFNCSSNDTSIKLTWYHYAAVGKGSDDVYDDKIKPSYEGRFDIASGTYNLLVQRPESNDAGKYECKEDPLETGTSAELTILDSELRCEANRVFHEAVGLMHCGQVIDSEESLLLCSVDYRGNIAPRMTWNINETESNKTKCGNGDKRAVCNATVDANLIRDGSVFTCQITTAEQYTCSLKVSKPTHTVRNITVMNETFCFANISDELQCEFKWTMDNNTVHMGRKLKTNKTGQYKCEIDCIIRNKTCGFIAMEVNVLEAEGSDHSTRSSWWISVVVVVVILLIFGIVLWMKRKQLGKIIVRWNADRGVEISSERPEAIDPIVFPLNHGGNSDDTVDCGSDPEAPSDESSQLLTITDKDVAESSFARFTSKAYIGEGDSGYLYGPFTWKTKKCVLKQILYPEDKLTDEKKQEIAHQINFFKNLNDDHLCQIFDFSFPSPALYIVMEYAEGKSLDKILCPKDVPTPLPPFSSGIVQNWCLQIAEGMKFLHFKNLVHRNLKSAHVLVMDSPDVLRNRLKIGSYTLIKEHDHATFISMRGTMAWMAPEYIRNEQCFKNSIDVWSYGVTVWEILTRDVPHRNVPDLEIAIAADDGKPLKLKIPDSCPQMFETLLRVVLTVRTGVAINGSALFAESHLICHTIASTPSLCLHVEPVCEDLLVRILRRAMDELDCQSLMLHSTDRRPTNTSCLSMNVHVHLDE